MRKLFLFLTVILAASTVSAQSREYAVGQVWEYRTAPGDEDSLIKIQETELIGPADKPIEVFHISMINIHLRDGGIVPAIQHLPVSHETLDQSVTRLSTSDVVFPDHREGMEMWREADGGVFTISLAEIGDVLRQSIVEGRENQQGAE